MDLPQLEHEITNRFGWAITLVLVAGSAFLIGNTYQPKNTDAPVEETAVTASSRIIDQIQQTLATDNTESVSVQEISPEPGAVGLVDDLLNVSGIGPKTLEDIRSLVTI